MTPSSDLRERFRFFHENAGYCVGRRAIGALAMARAEMALDLAEETGLVHFETEPEEFPDLSWADKQTMERIESGYYQCLCAYIRRDCPICRKGYEVLASLGGIVSPWDAYDTYPRVVRAELALEALDQIDQ